MGFINQVWTSLLAGGFKAVSSGCKGGLYFPIQPLRQKKIARELLMVRQTPQKAG